MMAPYAPTIKAIDSNKDGNFHSLKASITTNIGLLTATMALTGPIGPFERACYIETRPSVFMRPPINPSKNKRKEKLITTQ